MPDASRLTRALTGVGFKPEHFQAVLSEQPPIDFWEVHAENYLHAGGPLPRMLEHLRQRYVVTIHGVGLSIGGEAPLDARHLSRVAELVQRIDPLYFSEHLAWSSHGGLYNPDLLPLPYRSDTLQQVCAHVDQVQSSLRRPLLLENPATYLEFASSTYSEGQFLAELVRRTGCRLLLDLNNLHVSCINLGRDPIMALTDMPLEAVEQIHLAGFALEQDFDGQPLLIDDHGSAIDDAVWKLFAEAIRRIGAKPTLLEWDQNLPTLDVLLAQASQASAVMQDALTRRSEPASNSEAPWPHRQARA